jgi:hypothetical protein
MKYRRGFLEMVKRYSESNTSNKYAEPTDRGLEQFFLYESKGIRPDEPDPYFQHLLGGKAWWEWTLNEYADAFEKSCRLGCSFTDCRWDGWYSLAYQFIEDPVGFKQLRQRIARIDRSLDVTKTPQDVINEVEEDFSRRRAECA